ncbi:L-threonine dehydratase catabolic TdcB [Eufriesea mexicana]|uniref:L-threonine ammonia-lyase isoform X1 n=1 Tax=Eufriesea mexicana TaxID=516756 RepID=UPI00083BF9A7|nr:PREDICTED: L-threonine ammonia-lyase isoform X1 [Eufriesea mexicana]OAD56869.1 L-threonine dehydratase catabolic TdcB [Eufriesea mexicana]
MRDLNRKLDCQDYANGQKFDLIAESRSNDLDSSLHNDEELVDPQCVEENPRKITFEDITSAAFKIKGGIINTSCVRSRLSDVTGIDLYLKKDFLQITGSFKERGARYALMMLSEEQKKAGVISASLGNHALALCYHGYKLGIPVTVVMPVLAPIMKITACRQYGADVIVDGLDMAEAKRIALRKRAEKGLTYINGYDHPDIMAGQGTLGLEIVEQVSNIDAVIVPIGGGGLIAGVALAVKTLHPNVTIIGVESERCPSFYMARKADRPAYTPSNSTLADGLAVPMVGYNAFATANSLIDKLIVVKEEWIAIAILKLVENEKCIVEGAGATGLAAILAGQLEELRGKRVVLPLCGGNIDTTILGKCLERGLAAEGRLLKFMVTVSDRPGGIAELCRMLASIGVSIKDIMHERAWIMSDIFSVDVQVVCETRDRDHVEQLKNMLYQNYHRVVFGSNDMSSSNLRSPLSV